MTTPEEKTIFVQILDAIQWLSFLPQFPDSTVLQELWVAPFEVTYNDPAVVTSTQLFLDKEIVLSIPGLDALELTITAASSGTVVPLELQLLPDFFFRLDQVPLALRLKSELFQPVKAVETDQPTPVPTFVPDPDKPFLEIALAAVSLEIDGNGNITLTANNPIDLPPCMIGDSGIVIEAQDIQLYLGAEPPPGKPAGWHGIYIAQAHLYLPGGLSETVGSLSLTNAFIGNGGFSGSVVDTWSPAPAAKLFGVDFSLEQVELAFVQNTLATASIQGSTLLPFFEEPLSVEISPGLNGVFAVSLSDANGLLTFTKPGLLSMTVQSLSFEIVDEVFISTLSGDITPLFGGLDWPTFDVKELSIDSQGNVHLDGGWLDLPDQYTFFFYSFLFEITRLGFGKSDDGGKWVGFSGSLTLCEGLPAGASVEGLRITWYSDGREPKITFNGVGVEFSVPDVLYFKGDVAYRELEVITANGATEIVHRFDGDIKLELEALDIAIDGKLVIGSVNDSVTGIFPFFAIYLALDLPAGLPLWATGLALYGMAGIFALEMAPNKGLPPHSAGESWYENADGSPGWYKRPATGVIDLASKWNLLSGSQALGGGITLGTIADNGYTFSGQMLLVISLPGPILLIEGRANILKQRAELDASEPTFRALAVLDEQAGTLSMGLDAQYTFGTGGELIDIHGDAEAFFSFHDAQAWHLHMGEKDPREKRLRAAVFKLFEADAYFLLNANQLALGAHVGYDEKWKFGPLSVALQAWIEGNSIISWKPSHFYGDLAMHGQAGLTIFGFGINLTVDAQIAADVFDPFHILGAFQVGIGLPFPLPDVQVGITLEWGPVPTPPPLPHPLKEVAIEHFKVTTSWPLPRHSASPLLLPDYDSNDDDFLEDPVPAVTTQEAAAPPENVPVVPLDCRPHITFARSMNDDAFVGVNVQPQVPEWERIGNPEKDEGPLRVRYSLEEVALEKYENEAWVLAARKGTTPNTGNEPELYGSWAPMPQMPAGDGENTGQVKLWLWSKTPFDFTCHTGSAWDDWFTDRYPTYPCISLPEDQQMCFDFEKINPETLLISPWTYPGQPGLIFSWPISTALTVSTLTGMEGTPLARMLCLPGRTGVTRGSEATIYLPQPVKQVDLFFVETTGILAMGIDVQNAIVPASLIDKQQIEISGADITRVVLLVVAPTACLLQICLTSGLTEVERAHRRKMIQHQQDALAHWSEVGNVLEPHTTYRLKIVSRLQAQGTGELANYAQDLTQTEFAYFRTEGPPGLTTYSVPANYPTPDEFESGLNDLTRYVAQTVPATVPSAGEKPLQPRPVYCAYDVSVVFNEDYVNLMYSLEDRELGLYLYNNNNQPARDIHERLLVFANHWNTVEQLTLPDSAQRWVNVVNASDCLSLDTTTISRPVALSSAAEGQVLAPDTAYEARLVPLLFQEDFHRLSIGSNAHGKKGVIGSWRIFDEGGNNGPSYWEVRGADDASDQYIVQASNIASSLSGSQISFKPATTLFYADSPLIPPDSSDQPGNWTDYRFSVSIYSGTAGNLGVLVRRSSPTSYYCVTLGWQNGSQHLTKVVNGISTILAENTFALQRNQKYLLTVDVVGVEIRVFLNGTLIFTASDNSIAHGRIGLHCDQNNDARFSNIRIDDLRNTAPVIYRFPFTTSHFANFFHQIHSFQDETWQVTLDTTVDILSRLSQAVAVNTQPSLEEALVYETLEELLRDQISCSQKEVKVTCITQKGKNLALLLQSPEPINWSRTELTVKATTSLLEPSTLPKTVKLTDVTFGDTEPDEESVTLLLRQAANLSGYRLEYLIGSQGTTDEAPPWMPYYTFGHEELLPTGTQVRIFSGSPDNASPTVPGIRQRFCTLPGQQGQCRFSSQACAVTLRLIGPEKSVRHRRQFLPESAYTLVAPKILRKADGTAFFLVMPADSAAAASHYRLEMTYRRDNQLADPDSIVLSQSGNTSAEEVKIILFPALS